jgi:hypothetical protein
LLDSPDLFVAELATTSNEVGLVGEWRVLGLLHLKFGSRSVVAPDFVATIEVPRDNRASLRVSVDVLLLLFGVCSFLGEVAENVELSTQTGLRAKIAFTVVCR